MGGSNPSANYALFCLESWNHSIKGMIEANSQKNRSNLYHMTYIVQLGWSKTTKHFSVNPENFLVDTKQAGKQVSKQVDSSFPPSDRNFSAFWVAILAKYVVLFILGKCLFDSYNDLWFLLKFGLECSIMFMYHSKTSREHVFFH